MLASVPMVASVSLEDYRALAEIRYRIRRFLTFSEASARAIGIEPQQHQLLLAVRGLPEGERPVIRALAERLQIAHNSAVELVQRSVERGLVVKKRSAEDARAVEIHVTARGERLLERLSRAHRAELRAATPALMDALASLVGKVHA